MFANYLLVSTIVPLIALLIYQKWPRESLLKTKPDATYDYIIIGAGSAGSVLANRLSRDKTKKVLLLEAGGEETGRYLSEIPLATTELLMTELDWSYLIEPQRNACFGYKNNQIYFPSGKVLGGSSHINFLIYSRGSPHDYNGWAAAGCEGWSYEEVMPYFLKSEGVTSRKLAKNKDYHSPNGSLPISEMNVNKLGRIFLDAGVELGYQITDTNAQEQLGVGYLQSNTRWGARCSTSTAFLRRVMPRKNLHVIVKAFVQKILVNNKRAVGVEFVKNETIYKVKSKHDVIVSAGAIGSPKILMLSGIGPKQHLQELGIPVKADLPVGLNLHDHVHPAFNQYFISKEIALTEAKAKSTLPMLDYLIFGQGPLSSTGVEGIGFFKSKLQAANESYPFLQFHVFTTLIGSMRDKSKRQALQKLFNVKNKVWNALYENLVDRHGFSIMPVLLHPKSRGFVQLRSRDPQEPPVIDPQYLSHPQDAQVLLEGIRLVQKFVKTDHFQAIGAKSTGRIHPFCADLDFDTDAYWLCFIKQSLHSAFHYSGTCKMGSVKDNSTVVDSQLRVKGISNLRVVDASIMPEVTSSNLNAPTIMIAEKAADLIRGKITVSPWKKNLPVADNDDFYEFDHDHDHEEL